MVSNTMNLSVHEFLKGKQFQKMSIIITHRTLSMSFLYNDASDYESN